MSRQARVVAVLLVAALLAPLPAVATAAPGSERSAANAGHRAAAKRTGKRKHRTTVTVVGHAHRTGVLGAVSRLPNVSKTQPGSAPAPKTAVPPDTPGGARVTLSGDVPDWATREAGIGRVRTAQQIPVTVVLGWSDPAQLAALAAAVNDPASPTFGHFLTPAQFRARFSPTAGEIGRTTAYLQEQGLTVDGVSRNGARISAHGAAGDVQAAFGTFLNTYRVRGRTLRAPNRAPSVPRDLADAVVGVQGLDQAGAFTRPAAAPPGLFRQAPPCGTSFGSSLSTGLPPGLGPSPVPDVPCGYTPAQLRSAYGIPPAGTGAGQSVGIVDAYASPTIDRDLATYSARHGLPAPTAGQLDQSLTPYWLTQTFQTFNPATGYGDDPQGWYGEQTLDVEAVHGVAPAAKIVYAGARSPFDVALDDALNDVDDSGLVGSVSNSYGQLESDSTQTSRAAFDAVAQQAQVTGVGLYVSSGDNGDEVLNSGTRQTDFPASSDRVTAVGGTAIGIGASGQYLWERYWGTDRSVLQGNAWNPAPGTASSFLYGGGGGTSAAYAQPAYQSGVPTSLSLNYLSPTAPHRVVPDVAAIADPQTGMIVGQTQTAVDGTVLYDEYRVGGTSLASPVFAAMMAVGNQLRADQSLLPIGFANPSLYAIAPGAWHDVDQGDTPDLSVARVDYVNGEDAANGTVTTLRAIGDLQSLASDPGYDDSTGLGTPNGSGFFDELVGLPSPPP